MVQPVQRGVFSGAATTGSEVVKYGVLSALAAGVLGAVMVGGPIMMALGAIGLATGSTVAFSGLGLAVASIGALIGGVSGVTVGGPIAATAGGIAGIFGGVRRVSMENQAYDEKMAAVMAQREMEMMQAYSAAQAPVMVSDPARDQALIQQTRLATIKELKQEVAQADCKVCGPETAKEMKRREAQAQHTTQVG